MDSTFAQRYRELYLHHWWFRAREAVLLETLDRYRTDGGFGRILDIGSGDGLFLERLEAFGSPEGLEPEERIVSQATRRRWPMHLGPFDDDFAPGHRYGLIGMFDVLEHLAGDVAALRRARDLLRPGGLLVITVPAFAALWTRHDDLNHHLRRYTRRSLGSAVREAGLRLLEQRFFFHWLAPVKLLVRAKERVSSASAPMSLPGPLVNRLLLVISRLEQQTWGRIGIPFGSSLLAVATTPETG